MTPFILRPLDDLSLVVSVHQANGAHVGYLKRIGAVWKFKAIGTTAAGEVVPGGGPLTLRHNVAFTSLAPALVQAGLCPPSGEDAGPHRSIDAPCPCQ